MSSRGNYPAPKPSTASMVEESVELSRESASESAGRTNAAYAPLDRKPLPAALEVQSVAEPAVVLRGSLMDDAEVDGESTMTYSKRPSQPSQPTAAAVSRAEKSPESQAMRPSVPVPRPRSFRPPALTEGELAPVSLPVSLRAAPRVPTQSGVQALSLSSLGAPPAASEAAPKNSFASVPPPSVFPPVVSSRVSTVDASTRSKVFPVRLAFGAFVSLLFLVVGACWVLVRGATTTSADSNTSVNR